MQKQNSKTQRETTRTIKIKIITKSETDRKKMQFSNGFALRLGLGLGCDDDGGGGGWWWLLNS